MTDYQLQLREKLSFRSARAAVIGMGYVGLPLAVTFAEAGYRVTGIDIDPCKVASINAGKSYVPDVSSERIKALIDSGALSATTDFSAITDCDALSICVPTPLRKTGDPDMSFIIDAIETIVPFLHPGMVIVLESTTYPSTTTEVVLPRLENNGSTLRVGESLFLAFSPERVDPGRTDWTTKTTPKVIGGATPACLDVACTYYGHAIDTLVPVSSTETAEMVKLLENTFRAVNIGLANEVLVMCNKLGLDAWEVINAAATKPFGFMKFTPGPGLGGHCIPIDPLYLSWRLKLVQYNARFIELASEINAGMPGYWVQVVQDVLNEQGKAVKGSKILILGVAYKRNVADVRESPALDIMRLLDAKGAVVTYHDPYVPRVEHEGMSAVGVEDLSAALTDSDCTIITTDHSSYDWIAVREHSRIVVDTRGVLAPR